MDGYSQMGTGLDMANMNPTPEFLRTLPYVPRLNEDDIQACADAWEAALLALWFEHYKDVYPEGRREAAYAELKALLDELGPKTDDLLADAKHLRAEAPDLVHARDLLAQALSRFAQKDKALRFTLDYLREIAIPMADAAGRVTSLNHAQRMIEQALGEDTRICVWTYDFHDDLWNTACGECFVFEDGTPLSNNQKFCGYCGKPIKESLVDNPPLP